MISKDYQESTIDIESIIYYHKEVVVISTRKDWVYTNPCRPMGDWKVTKVFNTYEKE